MIIPLPLSIWADAKMGFYCVTLPLDYIERAGVLFLVPFEGQRNTFGYMLERMARALP